VAKEVEPAGARSVTIRKSDRTKGPRGEPCSSWGGEKERVWRIQQDTVLLMLGGRKIVAREEDSLKAENNRCLCYE